MSDFWSALKSYLYGLGWLLLLAWFLPVTVRRVLALLPADARRELDQRNLAMALFLGLVLLGLSVGFATVVAHVL